MSSIHLSVFSALRSLFLTWRLIFYTLSLIFKLEGLGSASSGLVLSKVERWLRVGTVAFYSKFVSFMFMPEVVPDMFFDPPEMV